MLDWHVADTRPIELTEAFHRLALEPQTVFRGKASLVEILRNERANARMKAPCSRQEHAQICGDGQGVAAQPVFERRHLGPGRVGTLLRLLELRRVAEQH